MDLLKMLQHLRHYEEVILFEDKLGIQKEEAIVAWLEAEYATESVDYPHIAPPFSGAAAYWAASVLGMACQMLLHRTAKLHEFEGVTLQPAIGLTASAILSADLTLRFLPDLLVHFRNIDPEDELIPQLEGVLYAWHYSGIGYPWPAGELDFAAYLPDACIRQLYLDRVIEKKDLARAAHPAIKQHVVAALGIYKQEYWQNLIHETTQ